MRGRRFKANKGTETPHQHIVIDTEARDPSPAGDGVKRLRLLCGHAVSFRWTKGVVSCRQEFAWTDPAEFWTWFDGRLQKRKATWVWAHNQSFDAPILGLFEQLDNGAFVRKWEAFGDDKCLLSGYYDGRLVAFVDSFHWTGRALRDLAPWVGMVKGEPDHDTAPLSEMQDYCRNDVLILERVVGKLLGLVRSLDLGCLRFTAASQALQHWRHLAGRPEVFIPSRPGEARLARDCYYGGMYFPFFIGKRRGPIWELDMNGAYCHAMAACRLPLKHIDTAPAPSRYNVFDRFDPLRCAACVEVDTREPLPVQHDEKGLLWATGRFVTHLAGPELAAAVKAGAVRRVRYLSLYELGEPCKAFADYWWARRAAYQAEGDPIMAHFAKMMPPRLYGKFVQLAERWVQAGPLCTDQRWGSLPYYDPREKRWHPGRVIAGQWEFDCSRAYQVQPGVHTLKELTGTKTLPRPDKGWSFPAIGAWITSFIRVEMSRFRAIAGPGNVLYQAVDSLHVTQKGFDQLQAAGVVSGQARGLLKVANKEGRPYQEVHYHGINLLRIDGRLKAAGLPGAHLEVAEGECETDQLERLDSILARGPDGTVHRKRHQWSIKDTVYGHFARDSGWMDWPHLPDDQEGL